MTDVKELLKKRPLSWSAISSFEWDKEQWYKRYVLGEKDPESREMLFGKALATSIEKGQPLAPVTIIGKAEHPFKVTFNGIPLIGFADNFCLNTYRKLGEYKSGKKAWDQKRVDEHGQLTMYMLMNYITNKVQPEEVDCFLEWVPTEETEDFDIKFVEPITVHHFNTKRTMRDIIMFGDRINKTVNAMQEYVKAHQI